MKKLLLILCISFLFGCNKNYKTECTILYTDNTIWKYENGKWYQPQLQFIYDTIISNQSEQTALQIAYIILNSKWQILEKNSYLNNHTNMESGLKINKQQCEIIN